MSRREQRDAVWDIFKSAPTPPKSRQSNLPDISNRSSKASIPERAETPKSYMKEDMPVIEIRGRLREVEVQLLDVRAAVERRISSFLDEFPNRLHQELKHISDRDSHLWSQNTQQVNKIQESLKVFQESSRTGQQGLFNEITSLRRRVEQLELNKTEAVQVPRVEKSQELNPMVLERIQSSFQSLREALQDEQQRRENAQKESTRQIQELHEQLRTQEKQLATKFQSYRDDIMHAQTESREKAAKLEHMKQNQYREETYYLRSIVNNLQKKVDEETSLRGQVERDYRQWTENKLQGVQQFVSTDKRNFEEKERKIVEMVQEGLGALHEIIARTREASNYQVSKVETLINENIKEIIEAVSTIKNNLHQRMEGIEHSLHEESRYRLEQQENFQNNLQALASSIEKSKVDLENQIMSSENRTGASIYTLEQKTNQNQKELEEWKVTRTAEVESANQSVLSQLESDKDSVHKTLDKLTRETQVLKKEVRNSQEYFENLVEQAKSKITHEDSLLEQRLNSAITVISDQLNKEIHDYQVSTQRHISNFEFEQAKTLASRIDQLQRGTKDEIAYAVREEMKQRKGDILSQDNSMRSHVSEIQSYLMQIFSDKLSEVFVSIEGTQSQVQKVQKTINEFKGEVDYAHNDIYEFLKSSDEDLKQWTQEELQKVKDKLTQDLKTKTRQLESNLESTKELLSGSIQQTSEGLKSEFKHLLTQESAERNSSEQSIMHNLDQRITSLEDYTKFTINKNIETLKSEVSLELEQERNKRHTSDWNTKNKFVDLEIKQSVERCVEDMVSQVSQVEFKGSLEESLQSKLEETKQNLEAKVEAQACLTKVIDYLVNQEIKESILHSEKNIDTMFENLEKLHESITQTIQENEEALREELSSLNKEVSGLQEEVQDRFDQVYEQVDTNTAVLEEVQVQQVVSSMLYKLERPESITNKTSLNLALEELSNIKYNFEQDKYQIEDQIKKQMQEPLESIQEEITAFSENLELFENSLNHIQTSDIPEIQKKLVELDQSNPNSGNLSTLKQEVEQLKQLLQEKSDTGLSEKVKEFQTQVTELKEAIQAIEKDKDTVTTDLSSKLQNMNGKLNEVQSAVQADLAKATSQQDQHQQSVMQQLDKLYSALQNLK